MSQRRDLIDASGPSRQDRSRGLLSLTGTARTWGVGSRPGCVRSGSTAPVFRGDVDLVSDGSFQHELSTALPRPSSSEGAGQVWVNRLRLCVSSLFFLKVMLLVQL